GHLSILVARERVYVNEAPVRVARGQSFVREFMEFVGRLGVGGLLLRGEWDHAAVESFVAAFANQPGVADPEARLRNVRERLAFVSSPAIVQVLGAEEAEAEIRGGDDVIVSDAARAAFFYARLVSLLEQTHAAVREGESADRYARHLRQTVMKAIECLEARVFVLRLLAHTASPPGPDPLATHAANVCVLSLCMGRLLGLGRGDLSALGFAALYHDVGRALRPEQPAEPEGPDELLPHILEGLRLCLEGSTLSEAATVRSVVVAEHHLLRDGVPRIPGAPPRPHPFSRLVAVADAFDRLQNGTPGSPPQNPAQALRSLRREPRRHDNAAVDLLQDVLGKTPRGTVLRLLSEELVIVLEGGAVFGHRPIVRRLRFANGRPDPQRSLRLLELSEVKGEADPAHFGVDWRREVLR
ncbi:MAG: HD domain-containing protein, partial [Planctomycetota bacterium]